MTIAGSRLLADRRVVFAGVGAPLEASVLAKRLHAPDLTIVLEGGSIGPRMLPGKLPVSTNEMRGAHDASMLTGDHRRVPVRAARLLSTTASSAPAQIDRFGNVNTSYIGDPDQPEGAAARAAAARTTSSRAAARSSIMTRHEPRRFVERVDFITSPGYLTGPRRGERAGLVRSRPVAVITDLALLGLRRGDREAAPRRAPARRDRASRCTRTRASSCCVADDGRRARAARADRGAAPSCAALRDGVADGTRDDGRR